MFDMEGDPDLEGTISDTVLLTPTPVLTRAVANAGRVYSQDDRFKSSSDSSVASARATQAISVPPRDNSMWARGASGLKREDTINQHGDDFSASQQFKMTFTPGGRGEGKG